MLVDVACSHPNYKDRCPVIVAPFQPPAFCAWNWGCFFWWVVQCAWMVHRKFPNTSVCLCFVTLLGDILKRGSFGKPCFKLIVPRNPCPIQKHICNWFFPCYWKKKLQMDFTSFFSWKKIGWKLHISLTSTWQPRVFRLPPFLSQSTCDICEAGIRRKTNARLSAPKRRMVILRCFLGWAEAVRLEDHWETFPKKWCLSKRRKFFPTRLPNHLTGIVLQVGIVPSKRRFQQGLLMEDLYMMLQNKTFSGEGHGKKCSKETGLGESV